MFATMMPLFAQRGGRGPIGPAGIGAGSGGGGGGDGPEILLAIVAVVVGLGVVIAVVGFVLALVGAVLGGLGRLLAAAGGTARELFADATATQRVVIAFGILFLLLLVAGGVFAGLCAADVVDRTRVRSELAAGIDHLFK